MTDTLSPTPLPQSRKGGPTYVDTYAFQEEGASRTLFSILVRNIRYLYKSGVAWRLW